MSAEPEIELQELGKLEHRTGGYHGRTLNFRLQAGDIRPRWYGTLTGHGPRTSA